MCLIIEQYNCARDKSFLVDISGSGSGSLKRLPEGSNSTFGEYAYSRSRQELDEKAVTLSGLFAKHEATSSSSVQR